MANDLSAFNSEAWSARLVTKLDQVNVVLPLVNRNWEGDLTQNKTVWVRTPGNITMSSYTRTTTISYQDLTPTKESFTVNDGEYFAFEVDDLDKAQSDINAMDVYMKRAVVAMNNKVEEKILGAMVSAPIAANQITSSGNGGSGAAGTATVTSGTISAITISSGGSGYTSTKVGVVLLGGGGSGVVATVTVTTNTVAAVTISSGGSGYTSAPTVVFTSGAKVTLDSTTTTATGIFPQFVEARARLSKQNVPSTPGSRWAIVDPDTTSLLLNDTAHFIRASDLGDKIVQYGVIGGAEIARTAAEAPGFIGMIAGFSVYETPHVPVDIVGGKYLFFGDDQAVSYAAQITEIEALRLQTSFANAVRGLLLHDTFVAAECAKRIVWLHAA
jgi:hypothetical protein